MPPVGGGLTSPVPFAPPARDLFRARQPFNTNPFKSFPYGGGSYFGPVYDSSYQESVAPGQLMPPPAIGLLRFDVTPESAQVFVDSFYVGTIADIEAQRVLALAAGPHRIELRAAGYQTVTFDVRINPNDTVVYRARLERERPAAPAAARPTGPTRMYVIPGCYAGNMAPRADRLPSGCDVKQVRVIDPPK
jgi:PEGA domain